MCLNVFKKKPQYKNKFCNFWFVITVTELGRKHVYVMNVTMHKTLIFFNNLNIKHIWGTWGNMCPVKKNFLKSSFIFAL